MENNQGLLDRFNGESQKAYDIFKKVADGYKNVLGTEHPSLARTLINLGTASRDLQKYEEAIGYYQQALDIREKMMGKDNVDYALTQSMMAGAY